MPQRVLLLLLLMFLSFTGCKEEIKDTNPGISEDYSELSVLKMGEIGDKFRNATTKSEKVHWLSEGIKASSNEGLEPYKDLFVMEMLKADPDHDHTLEYLWYLSERWQNMGRHDESSILCNGIRHRYKSESITLNVERYLKSEQKNIHNYLNEKFMSISGNGIDSIRVVQQKKYIQLIEAFALAFPSDEKCPEYLLLAAEMAGQNDALPEMVSMFDWVLQYYPQSKDAPISLFLKGFYLDEHFGKKEDAKSVYNQFVAKYPDHRLANDVKLLLSGKNHTTGPR